ncbi:MAG: biotin transporter BioY [Pseudonocardiales bacterium]|nr:MAG: biotin transporter BioY [Pseudonocardiales bacterium]
MAAASIDVRRRIVLADLLAGGIVRDVVLVAAFASLTGMAAQLSFHIPGTPVPVTGQTFAALLAGAAVGPVRGFASMAVYLLVGTAGVPWFAGHASGAGAVSFGYVVGFVVAATVVGWLARRGGDRTPLRTVATMVLGTVVIYAFGVPWLAASAHLSLADALSQGARPFLPGDLLKVVVAAALLPSCWSAAQRFRRPS